MPRQNFVDGMEITYSDLSAVASQHEREIYDRVIWEMLQEFSVGFFGGGFLVSRVSSTQVSVAAGSGFYLDNTQVDPEPQMRPLYLSVASPQNIAAPDATNSRIDIVCTRPNRANAVTASRHYEDPVTKAISLQNLVIETDWLADVQVVTGTPSGSPAAPATPAGWTKVAEVVVTAVSGIAASGAITDKRTKLPVGGDIVYNTLGFNKLTAGATTKMSQLLSDIDGGLSGIAGAAPCGGFHWTADGVADGAVTGVTSNCRVAFFPSAATVRMVGTFQVPNGYVAGRQIQLYASFFTADASGNMLMRTVATLIRQNTDAISSTTNQRTSTNAQLVNTVANAPRRVLFDLTDSTGNINGVAVSPGDLIHVEVTRAYASESVSGASEVQMLLDSAEMKL
jgi:hypothetical protein